MHNKVVVVDDTVVTGSFNFSDHASNNAENIVVVHNRQLATRFARYVRSVISKHA